ncbi:ribosome biogenesis protein SLX9-domain-containing protein [Stachybotrys elegans]|uniref:Ribosome biogenesis protein SLX9 n=1 Tax=Stachybotrys elegans TaxID=80388 RepID=A0A8K0SNB0_9HYPO|nr:ribosome biogenesis protein SLX9-domain-containing protein [Stachybotrys elegans]
MAPIAPNSKPSARALRHMRVTGQIHPQAPAKVFRPDAAVSDDFLKSKRDKRMIKHSSFVSRITSSRITKAKRRRPAKKLRTNLDSLADALPELDEDNAEPADGKVRHRSLKSKRGALKRKERVVRGEMERFGASMAKLAGTTGAPAQQQQANIGEDMVQDGSGSSNGPTPAEAAATSNRWAALRGYISSTMEQNPAFKEKS